MWGSWGGDHAVDRTAPDPRREPCARRTARRRHAAARPHGLDALGDGWHSEEHTIPRIGLVWPSLLTVLRPLAYRAATPTLPAAERQALLLLFEALAEGPLAAPGHGLQRDPPERAARQASQRERAGQVLRRDGRTVVLLGCQNIDYRRDRVNWLALDHDPTGVFGAVAHFTLEQRDAAPPALPADTLAAVTRSVRAKGAAPWQPEAPAAFAASTHAGLGPSRPRSSSPHVREKLDAETRPRSGSSPVSWTRATPAEHRSPRGAVRARRRSAARRPGRAVDDRTGHRVPRAGCGPPASVPSSACPRTWLPLLDGLPADAARPCSTRHAPRGSAVRRSNAPTTTAASSPRTPPRCPDATL